MQQQTENDRHVGLHMSWRNAPRSTEKSRACTR